MSPASLPTLQFARSGDTHGPSIADQRSLRSSPIAISSPRRRSPNVHYASSATPHSHSEHWSLFGQLMENEGHLGVTPASISSRPSSSAGDYFTRGSTILSESSHSNIRTFAQHRPDEIHDASPGRRDLALHGVPIETNEYDSDDSSTTSASRHPPTNWFSWTPQSWQPSVVWRNVFKCAIAYFVASLFTFSPYLSRWISPVTSDSSTIPSPSGHMVATM